MLVDPGALQTLPARIPFRAGIFPDRWNNLAPTTFGEITVPSDSAKAGPLPKGGGLFCVPGWNPLQTVEVLILLGSPHRAATQAPAIVPDGGLFCWQQPNTTNVKEMWSYLGRWSAARSAAWKEP